MTNAAFDQAATSGGVGLGDYLIYPEQPLPALSVGRNMAYRAASRERPEQAYFALVCDPAALPRLDAMEAIRKLAIPTLLTPLDWRAIDWPPSGRRNVTIVFDKPEEGRLFTSLNDTLSPLSEEVVIREYLQPIVAALRALATAGIVHGAVNPTNILFRQASRQGLALGECVSMQTAVHQPTYFLPIEAALAAPAARGHGQVADDVFALGMTAAFLLLGSNPVAALVEDDLMRARIDFGSYTTLLGDRRIPVNMIDFMRGVLADDAKLRWNLGEIEEWLSARRFVLRQGTPMRRATRPFEFEGTSYLVPRALSYAFAQQVDAAVKAVRGRDFENWAQRALGDETGIALIKNAQAESVAGKPGEQRDAAFVARVCIALDSQAPIRYRDLAAAVDGLGGALASAFLEGRSFQTIAEAINQRLPQFWFAARTAAPGDHVAPLKLFERLRPLLDDRRLGCGAERVLYELNPSLHCLSPLIEADHIYSLAGLLAALETQAAAHLESGDLIDRHIAAFIAARFKTATSDWVDGLASPDPARRLISILRALARLQAHGGPASAPNLVKWVARQATPLVDAYHHRPTRQRLNKQVDRATQAGKLVELMLIVDNPVERQHDAEGFAEARRAHATIAGELNRLVASAAHRPQQIASLAGQMAASFATLLAVCASLVAALMLG